MTRSSLRRQGLPLFAMLFTLSFSITTTFSQQPFAHPDGTTHYYEWVSDPNAPWTQAEMRASKRCFSTPTGQYLQGYLVTVTSQAEMDFVLSISKEPHPTKGCEFRGGWMGGSDKDDEGVWRWVTGPEGQMVEEGKAGQIFWKGGSIQNGGGPYMGRYNNWQIFQPDQETPAEDFVHYYAQGTNTPGKWNDFPNGGANNQVGGYVVEYGGLPCATSFCPNPNNKVTICHAGTTMEIPCSELQTHMGHGDLIGAACPVVCTPVCVPGTPSGNKCTKKDNCYVFTYSYGPIPPNATDNTLIKLTFTVTVNCDKDLSNVAFELPSGKKAKSPTGPPSTIENPTSNPFYSVKFETRDGFKNGKIATFSYSLTYKEFQSLTTIRVRAKSGHLIGSVTFNKDIDKCAADCPPPPPPPAAFAATNSDDQTVAPAELMLSSISASAIFPNPSTGNFNLSLKGYEREVVQIRITSANGKEIERRKVVVNSARQVESFNLQGLPKGLYYINIIGNKGSSTNKVVIR